MNYFDYSEFEYEIREDIPQPTLHIGEALLPRELVDWR